MIEHYRIGLLTHPVTKTYLDYKWLVLLCHISVTCVYNWNYDTYLQENIRTYLLHYKHPSLPPIPVLPHDRSVLCVLPHSECVQHIRDGC